jgi:hypothetical protein
VRGSVPELRSKKGGFLIRTPQECLIPNNTVCCYIHPSAAGTSSFGEGSTFVFVYSGA